MKLLVTGFPPFDAYPINSTHMLIESMNDTLPAELESIRESITFEIINFDNTDSASQQRTMLLSYRRAMDAVHYDLCLFCGQAASRPMLTVETIAINRFKGELIDPQGPPAYWATLPDQAALIDKLRSAVIPARLSYHAGTHLCNHILYTALREAQQFQSGVRAGFLHFPMTTSQVIESNECRASLPLSMMRTALTIAILHLLHTS